MIGLNEAYLLPQNSEEKEKQRRGQGDLTMDLFTIWRRGLRTARPILSALATVGNQGNPYLSSASKRLSLGPIDQQG